MEYDRKERLENLLNAWEEGKGAVSMDFLYTEKEMERKKEVIKKMLHSQIPENTLGLFMELIGETIKFAENKKAIELADAFMTDANKTIENWSILKTLIVGEITETEALEKKIMSLL